MHKLFIGVLIVLTALTSNAQTSTNNNKATVKWYTLEEAQALNAKAPRKIFIDVYTDWCGWCKVLDNNTFSDPEVAKCLNTYFYPVKFNGEGKEPVVFNGHTFNFNAQHKCHDLAIAILQGKMSYPSMAFINEKLELLTLLQSYLPPEELLPILVFFAQNYFEKMKWQEFIEQWPEIKKQKN